MKHAIIYEVRLEIDPKVEHEYDAWLAGHIAEMLGFDGFLSAEILVPDSPAEGAETERIVRQVQYHVASRAQLEHYLEQHADRMRQQGVERFGSGFSATRTIYDLGVRPARVCQNCDTPLRGQYCEECGQRDKHRIISLWELLRDLVGDLFEFDSRIWRTLHPLLFKPGRLTTEYLRGRRVHYTPPLRLYLVSSLLFFLVVFFNADTDVIFDGQTDARDIAEALAEADADPEDIADMMAALEDAPVADGDNPVDSQADSTSDPEPDTGSRKLADFCEKINAQGTAWDAAIERRAKHVCRKLAAEGGATRFLRDLIDNAPTMMFFFLPVIALVMAFLYPFSRRYYVEHLLFFVHFHSFFFLILTLNVLLSRLPVVFPGQDTATQLLTTVVIFYIPVYLFVAMRRVYQQSFWLTAVKYTVLGVAYFVSLLFSFAAMAFFTALSV